MSRRLDHWESRIAEAVPCPGWDRGVPRDPRKFVRIVKRMTILASHDRRAIEALRTSETARQIDQLSALLRRMHETSSRATFAALYADYEVLENELVTRNPKFVGLTSIPFRLEYIKFRARADPPPPLRRP